ncbi:MAG: YraN family protein [Burkholderiales bacterium]|nr:YraN family protein [Burkholderiales bacterium]
MTEAGKVAEDLAARYLASRGLKLITRNYRCRFGEIDLILQDGKTTVFAEVRLRESQRFGGAAASVGTQKQQRLIATAQHYLAGQHTPPICRFDVITLDRLEPSAIEWIKDAFGE